MTDENKPLSQRRNINLYVDNPQHVVSAHHTSKPPSHRASCRLTSEPSTVNASLHRPSRLVAMVSAPADAGSRLRRSITESELQGLNWETTSLGLLQPKWATELDLKAVEETIQSLNVGAVTNVRFLARGAFNMVFEVQTAQNPEPLILRVTLPVDPLYKTASEVATLNWLRQHANIPVPMVIDHDSSRRNILGFEWILMSKLPGRPLADEWRSLSYPAKKQLVRQLAEYSSTMFENQLRGIGNIYTSESSPEVGRIVSMHFFWGDRIRRVAHRGPFSSSTEWIHARLALVKDECLSTLTKYSATSPLDSDEEDDLEGAERTLAIIERLTPFIDRIFPCCGREGGEPSMVFHDDLSRHNILMVDGQLGGVVDWECVSALPLWRACDFPSFLKARRRDTHPDPKLYGREADGELTELYWDHLEEFELTQLRQVFLSEMTRLSPGWVEVFNRSGLQRDFDTAVHHCDNEILARRIELWLSDLENATSLSRVPNLPTGING
ncbi:hypothetical protein ACRALDRAFT_2051251 [Sodiomyces alcalophilus JCM 7366]|uniref:uncharacterized protein n=1 Tax=Sodiomyces alcalophilus JCM 7366 TaxID=591952 RepID=UPI0039B48A6A